MRPVCCDYEAKNEYTCPIDGSPYYRSSGIIFAEDLTGCKYAVSRIDFERYDDQNYQYVFSPQWGVIDALPASVFQGIPGLDMSLRLKKYYRVNMTPYFIAERTPGEGREDLWELLEEAGLDYYDRFEWLLRTNMRCGTDNLIVERVQPGRELQLEEALSSQVELQPDDCVIIRDFRNAAATEQRLRKYFLEILRSGARVLDESEGSMLSEAECSILLKYLLTQDALEKKENKSRHRKGVARAKESGKYTGRKRIEVDPNLLKQVAEDFRRGRISEEEAMGRTKIGSRSTFYRRLKELQQTAEEEEKNI